MVRGRIRHEEQHRAGERSDADGRPEGGVPLVPGPRAQLLPAARGPVTCRVAGGAGERAHASPGGDQGWRRHCSNTTACEDGKSRIAKSRDGASPSSGHCWVLSARSHPRGMRRAVVAGLIGHVGHAASRLGRGAGRVHRGCVRRSGSAGWGDRVAAAPSSRRWYGRARSATVDTGA